MKKFLSFFVVICMLFGLSVPVFANSYDPSASGGYVYISLDINTLGDGFLLEPIKVPFNAGENYADVTDRFFNESGVSYGHWGTLNSGFYMDNLTLPRNITVNVPQVILDKMAEYDEEIDGGNKTAGQTLNAFDYTFMSGWMYTVNNETAPMGASDWYPEDGDVCRWQFTLCGYGSDLGVENDWGEPPYYAGADKSELITAVAEINSASDKAALLAKPGVPAAYNNAYAVLQNLTAEQAHVNSALTALTNALSATAQPGSMDISAQLNATLAYMVSTVPAPAFGIGAGEWTVLTLARSGYSVPEGYYEGYYNRIESIVRDAGGILPGSGAKKTEYSRLIMGLSSIGRGSANVGGYDLTAWLSGMPKVTQQGINGPIFALIALDTNNYDIPDITEAASVTGYTANEADQATRQRFIDYILDKEIKKGTADAGGWALSGTTPDPDMTAMALQALAPYRSGAAVSAAIDRAVDKLSSIQNASGGFASWGTVNAESIAQVIVALTTLGINPATDSRFVKASGNAVTALMQFYKDGGGFCHTAGAAVNGIATDQAGYALVAYDRFVKGKSSLYNMTDAFETNTPIPDSDAAITIEAPDEISGNAGTAFNVIVKASSFPEGEFKLMDGIVNIPELFNVEDVQVSGRLTGGSLTWHYDESDNKLRFVYANMELNNIGLSGGAFPAELFTVKLTLKCNVDTVVTPGADISIGGVTLKEASDIPSLVFDVSEAITTVAFIQPEELAITVRELFTGDGVDLIPADKRAVAVTVIGGGIAVGGKMEYKDSKLFYSPEMTGKYGVNTYILMISPSESGTDLLDKVNYSISEGAADTVTFGDTDGNGFINAQDALDVISGWLRKTAVTDDLQIFSYNVTSDSRINTYDALGIMENYVSHSEFAILAK